MPTIEETQWSAFESPSARAEDEDIEQNFVEQAKRFQEMQQASMQASVEEVLEEEEKEQETQLELNDVDVRLEEANCYRALLQNSLFNDSNSISRKVENEIRNFIRQRLRVLLGMESDKPKESQVFNANEVAALKSLAERVLKTKPVTPQVNKTEFKPEPVVAKANLPETKVKPSTFTPVPEKVKSQPRKKKVSTVINPINGEEIKVDVTPQSGQKTRRTIEDLQAEADAATAQAMRQVQAGEGFANSLLSKLTPE